MDIRREFTMEGLVYQVKFEGRTLKLSKEESNTGISALNMQYTSRYQFQTGVKLVGG